MERTFNIDGKECKIIVDFDKDPVTGISNRLGLNAIREAISDEGYYISASIEGELVTKRGNAFSKYLGEDLALTASDLFYAATGIPYQGALNSDPVQMLKEQGFI